MIDVEWSGDLGVDKRAVIDALPRAVVVTDATGVILLWNEAAERLYGWLEREVLGRSVVEVLAPLEELGSNREHLAFVAAGNPTSGDRSCSALGSAAAG